MPLNLMSQKVNFGVVSFISGHSKKKHSVALSTAEAEYIATGACCSQILWIVQQL